MPKQLAILSLALALAIPCTVFAGALGPCDQIYVTCKSAGFVEGDYKKGYGLWIDCIDPILHGTPQPPNADKPLPPVSPELVAACKQKRPNFGEGKRPRQVN